MINPSLKKEILNQLNRLGVKQQKRVLDFARSLSSAKPNGLPGKTLLSFAGTIAAGDLRTIARAIEEDCEKVNLNEW
jgi:hypothetical protein